MMFTATAAVLLLWAVVAVGTTLDAERDDFTYSQYGDSSGSAIHQPQKRWSSTYQDTYYHDQSSFYHDQKASDAGRRLLPDNINVIGQDEEYYVKGTKHHNNESHRKHSKSRLHHSNSHNYLRTHRRQDNREADALTQDYYDMLLFERQMQSSDQLKHQHNHHHHNHHHNKSTTQTNHHKHHKHHANQKQSRKHGSRTRATSTVMGTEYASTYRPKFIPSQAQNSSWHVQSDSRRVMVEPESTPSPAELSKMTAAAAARANSIQRTKPVDRDDDVLTLEAAPEFDNTVTANVMAQLGSHAYLPCRIIHLGDKSVSWVRNNDSHILTVDRYTFISDDRFTARFEASSQTWTLQIKFVSDLDAGSYECQVSTEPKMSRSIQLRIVHPIVTIPGGSELHVRSGSDVDIKCVIAHAIQPPPYVFWYHEGAQMNVEGGAVQRVSADTALAVLTIRGARRNQAGNYTCSPAGLLSASVTLHVLNGEHPAAMQHGTSNTPSSGAPRPLPPALGAGLLLLPLLALLLLPSDRWTPPLLRPSFDQR